MASYAEILQDSPTPLSVLQLPPRSAAALANRRTLPRVHGAFTVQAEGIDYRGVDLSFGGLMCSGPEPLWPGNTIPMTVHLAGERTPIAIWGEVVDLVPNRGHVAMRVRFVDLDSAERRRLAVWMSDR